MKKFVDDIPIELLTLHVEESNAIENIFNVGKKNPLFADHLDAAKLVYCSAAREKFLLSPKSTHHAIMRRVLKKDAGRFREVRVWVGSEEKISSEKIPAQMKKWQESLKVDFFNIFDISTNEKEKLAWHYHDWFESIHPFIDGNGRTGRLILNSIRLLVGLPWLTVMASGKYRYYEKIREWEKKHITLLI